MGNNRIKKAISRMIETMVVSNNCSCVTLNLRLLSDFMPATTFNNILLSFKFLSPFFCLLPSESSKLFFSFHNHLSSAFKPLVWDSMLLLSNNTFFALSISSMTYTRAREVSVTLLKFVKRNEYWGVQGVIIHCRVYVPRLGSLEAQLASSFKALSLPSLA